MDSYDLYMNLHLSILQKQKKILKQHIRLLHSKISLHNSSWMLLLICYLMPIQRFCLFFCCFTFRHYQFYFPVWYQIWYLWIISTDYIIVTIIINDNNDNNEATIGNYIFPLLIILDKQYLYLIYSIYVAAYNLNVF